MKLPSDDELKSWDSAALYAWGEKSWKWGDACSKLVTYNKHFIKCLQGDKLECTYVNQVKPK